MSDPADIITRCTQIVAALLEAKEEVGITHCELRFEGQGVDMVTPGIIVLLSPPTVPLGSTRGMPWQSWEVTLFILPRAKAIVSDEITDAMRIAQKAHMVVRRTARDLVLNADEPFSIVRSTPTQVICTVSYDAPFNLFP